MAWKNTSSRWVGVIGAGEFGTAVANLLAYNTDVLLYVRRGAVFEAVQQTRISAEQSLAANVHPIMDLQEVVDQCRIIFSIVPSQSLKALLKNLAPLLKPHHMLIHGIKGLDVSWPVEERKGSSIPFTRAQVKTMSELIQSETSVTQIGCLAGPNLASELAQKQPAAAVIASKSKDVLEEGQRLLRSERFQIYTNTDLLGVELCGSLKNIIAIGAGCLGGLGYGENARGLLISRGLVEMIHIGKAMGASVQPFLGLAGIGDLVATCSSRLSRNYTLGYRLAKGETLQQILASTTDTIEGIHTVQAITHLVKHYQMRAPITEMIYRILFEELSVKEAIQYLTKYPLNIDVDFL
jgi:glycerol-3-phosphate dehydrogenase (NAD(P)+)